jgi:chromosome partitioning protein
MSVISIANHKGGVGKTTTTVNLAAGLARQGHRVLMVDLDPQANATFSLGLKKQEKSIFNVLAFDEPIRKIIQNNGFLDIAPSSIHLAGFEKNNDVGKEFILSEAMEDIRSDYDFILIDCPPSLGALTISALTASDFAIIALQPEFLAIQGMADFVKILRTVKTRMNKDLELLGIVVTQYDNRKVLHKEILEHTRQSYGEMVFDSQIRGNITLAEAQSMGQDIFEYDVNSNGAKDYARLTKEVVKRTIELVGSE